MSLSLINHLLQSYGYFGVFAFIALESLGIPLPGETTLIAAGVLRRLHAPPQHRGHLPGRRRRRDSGR